MADKNVFCMPDGVCCVCNAAAIYTCPCCDLRTCSLQCVRKHKEVTGCDGRVPQAYDYIDMRFYNESDLLNDVQFLDTGVDLCETASRRMRLLSRNPNAVSAVHAKNFTKPCGNIQIPVDEQGCLVTVKEIPEHALSFLSNMGYKDGIARRYALLQGACTARAMKLFFLPVMFDRHVSNTSVYNVETDEITWAVDATITGAYGPRHQFTKRYEFSEKCSINDLRKSILSDLPDSAIIGKESHLYLQLEATERGAHALVDNVIGAENLRDMLFGTVLVEYPRLALILSDTLDSLRALESESGITLLTKDAAMSTYWRKITCEPIKEFTRQRSRHAQYKTAPSTDLVHNNAEYSIHEPPPKQLAHDSVNEASERKSDHNDDECASIPILD